MALRSLIVLMERLGKFTYNMSLWGTAPILTKAPMLAITSGRGELGPAQTVW
eukprot:COSAG02_NODE_45298_length_358_cov_1.000000_1_plen_52_part_00